MFVSCGGTRNFNQTGSLSWASRHGKTLKFRFAPPDGTKVVLTSVTKRVKTFEGIKEQKDHLEVKSNLEYKSLAGGYTILVRSTSSNMTRDGLLGEDPVAAMLKDVEIKYYVSDDGKISDIKGYDAVEQKAQLTLSETLKPALLPVLNEESLKSQEIREWNDKIADFVGREVVVGEVLDVEVPFALPNGQQVTCVMQTKVSGLESCPAGKCVRIQISYSSYQNEIGAFESMDGRKTNDKRVSKGPFVFGTTSRLIDPNTMLIYSDERTRTLKMMAELPDHATVPVTLTETRTDVFEYL